VGSAILIFSKISSTGFITKTFSGVSDNKFSEMMREVQNQGAIIEQIK